MIPAWETAAVDAAGLGVPGRDVFPWQGLELVAKAGLVAFDGQYVVRAAAVQVGGVAALCVHRIGGNHGIGQVLDLVQGRCEHGDLVGLAVHGDLRADHAGRVVQAGHQVRGGLLA